jgi:hypothetical protein
MEGSMFLLLHAKSEASMEIALVEKMYLVKTREEVR